MVKCACQINEKTYDTGVKYECKIEKDKVENCMY